MTADTPGTNQVSFQNPKAKVTITVLAADLVRVRMSPGSIPGPDHSWAVIKSERPAPKVEFQRGKGTWVIRTPALEVRVRLAPFLVAFYDRTGRLISQDFRDMALDGARVRCWKTMPPGEHYYGLGEKAGSIDKRGHAYVMWNTDPSGYDALTDPMYQTIPFFLGVRAGKAYGIFFDNSYRSSFDMGSESPDYYSFGAEGGEINYYFFAGPDPKRVISRYTELVGRTELPPLWSLGYIQSSIAYYPEKMVRLVAGNLRQRHIPCDALFLDTMHMDGSRDFTWDKSGFPDPARMLGGLRQQGFHVIAIVDPGLKVDKDYWVYQQGLAGNHFLRKKDGTLYTGYMWPGLSVFPDFSAERTRGWWASLFEGLLNDGISGFLTDMNEPTVDDVPQEKGWVPRALDPDVIHDDNGLKSPDGKMHNLYGLLMSWATRDALLRFRPNERPLVITRATYAGGQRYAAQWTGDNLATWEDFRASLRLIISMGVSGLPFTGSDTGGFIGTPNAELYTRWLEAGIFHPYFWTHTGDANHTLDPWSYGNEAEAINRRIIELRYRLLPYLYNAFYESTRTGLPIVRGLLVDYPDDEEAMAPTPDRQNYEFMFGPDLLVAPVVMEGRTTRKVYFPQGTWYDFWSTRRYEGRSTATVDAPLDHIPIFVRAGAILPMRQVVQFTNEAPVDPLTLEIYPGGNSSREFYEDDGHSLGYRNGAYSLEKITVSEENTSVNIRLLAPEGSYTPPSRFLIFKVHGVSSSPRAVRLNQEALRIEESTTIETTQQGAGYERESRTVWVKTSDTRGSLEIVIEKQRDHI